MQQKQNMEKSTLPSAQQKDAKEGAKPFAKYHAGAIIGTVWKNEGKDNNGKDYQFYTSTIVRVYKDQKGEWQSSGSFRKDDLPKVRLVSEQIYSLLVLGNDSE